MNKIKRMGYLFICLSLLLASTAGAHHIDAKIWGHEIEVKPSHGVIMIDYDIEIPAAKLAKMANRFMAKHGLSGMDTNEEARFDGELIDHLISGLKVEVAGKPLIIEWNPNFTRGRGIKQAGYSEYELHLMAPISAENTGKTVVITNDNFPMQHAHFHNSVKALASASVADIELVEGSDQEVGDKGRMISFTYIAQNGAEGNWMGYWLPLTGAAALIVLIIIAIVFRRFRVE